VPTACYLVEYTDQQRVSLRRFGFGPSKQEPDRHACPSRPDSGSWRFGCDASSAAFATVPLEWETEGGYRKAVPDWPHDDPHWPDRCGFCGEPFEHAEMWQTNGDPLMRVTEVVPGTAVEVGDEYALSELPPGAMWLDPFPRRWDVGFDGRALSVKLPDNHVWQVDGEATNCTRRGDRTHRCWLREGEPPYVTVGNHPDDLTCSAGAGSIASPGYHGFLQNGVLT
jgi:hypothetical protein